MPQQTLKFLREIVRRYEALAFLGGLFLIVISSFSVSFGDGKFTFATRTDVLWLPFASGLVFMAASFVVFFWPPQHLPWQSRVLITQIAGGGYETRVQKTTIQLRFGRIERLADQGDCAVVLPANEYF